VRAPSTPSTGATPLKSDHESGNDRDRGTAMAFELAPASATGARGTGFTAAGGIVVRHPTSRVTASKQRRYAFTTRSFRVVVVLVSVHEHVWEDGEWLAAPEQAQHRKRGIQSARFGPLYQHVESR